MIKVKNVELLDDDVYFMVVLDTYIVVNDNYKGIIVFDSELRKTEKIEIMEDLTIYSSFQKGNELFLYCPDNGCFIYVNLILHQKKIISLAGFDKWIFSTVYTWDQENIILSDYQGHFIKVDLVNGCIIGVDLDCVEYQRIKDEYIKLSGFVIYKTYFMKKTAIVHFTDSKIGLVEYGKNLNILKTFKKEQYHDFEMVNDYVAKIGENKLEVLFNNKMEVCYPLEQYVFLRGKFMVINEETYLFLLSSSKSDCNHIKIEKYIFHT